MNSIAKLHQYLVARNLPLPLKKVQERETDNGKLFIMTLTIRKIDVVSKAGDSFTVGNLILAGAVAVPGWGFFAFFNFCKNSLNIFRRSVGLDIRREMLRGTLVSRL